MTELARLHVTINGRVQGVGFRMATQKQARTLGLVGWVANRMDGSVEVVAEGEDFVLHAPIGLADAEEVRVQRRGDDLVVHAGPERRILTLPSTLRRCTVGTASVGEGQLTVRFVRNEEVWPRGR